MTPKEKAEELFEKYRIATTIKFKFLTTIPAARECALIAVDEILNEYPSQCPKDSYEMERHLYWQQVKQEIEKL